MGDLTATCNVDDHQGTREFLETGAPVEACQRAAAIFRALGETNRLRILALLMRGERCVTELAEVLGDGLSAVSQRLRLLRSERLVKSRREGKHIFYALADQHVAELVANALEHAGEATAAS
jgi:ArsR family transcriptional regulator